MQHIHARMNRSEASRYLPQGYPNQFSLLEQRRSAPLFRTPFSNPRDFHEAPPE
jgi:hypothetical protein